MSENLNRSTPDFSKYDSMSIGELEEILRADAHGPERDDSDVDEILYVMEVLAKKRRQNGIAGKTALEAYQEFQQHYHPMVEERAMPKHKSNIIPFRRIAAIAACLVLVFSFATSANAFSFRDVWNAVVTWAQETFSFSMGVEVSEPTPDDCKVYSSLQDVLNEAKITVDIIPSLIPEGYVLSDILVDENPKQKTYVCMYLKEKTPLRICVQSFLLGSPEQIEKSADFQETYCKNGIDFYLFANHDQTRAMWIIDTYECSISGELSIAEIKAMIDSIWKG